MEKTMSRCVLGVLASAMLLAGCQSMAPKRNLDEIRIVADPSLATTATLDNLNLTAQGAPTGADHLFITGAVTYGKSRCDVLSIKGHFVDAEGKVLYAMSGALSGYEKGTRRSFRLLPQGTEPQKANMSSAPITRGVVTSVTCSSLGDIKR